MAIDGMFCAKLAEELKALVGAKIEKINQTGDEEVLLRLYGDGKRYSLLLSASRKNARVCLCGEELPPQNPIPTSFCMLLRKHLMNGRISAVFAPENERIVCIDIESRDELGYLCRRRVYAELMGKYSNILLTDIETTRVLGALYQTDITFAARTVLVGLPYEGPPKQDKVSPFGVDKAQFFALCEENGGRTCADFFLKTFACFSPLTAREAAHRAGAGGKTVADADTERLWLAFTDIISAPPRPCLVTDVDGHAVAFSYTPLTQYGEGFSLSQPDSLSALLWRFFEEKGKQENHDRHSADIQRLVSTIRARIEKKAALQAQSLKDCEQKEEFRRAGDMIIANIYLLKQGMESATLMDYETGTMQEVKLDKRLTPAANAKVYYKKYTKLKHAETAMADQLAKTDKELKYIDTVADALRRAESDAEFDDLRSELESAGYIKARGGGKRKKQLSRPFEYKVDGGYTVKVGRNNVQNDELTFSAGKGDLWFHVKNAPGSHTVLYAGGEEPSALAYTQAAMIAAHHSSLQGAPSVAVDYAAIRFVKKPNGSAPGYVNYTHFYTAFVDAKLPEGITEKGKKQGK